MVQLIYGNRQKKTAVYVYTYVKKQSNDWWWLWLSFDSFPRLFGLLLLVSYYYCCGNNDLFFCCQCVCVSVGGEGGGEKGEDGDDVMCVTHLCVTLANVARGFEEKKALFEFFLMLTS